MNFGRSMAMKTRGYRSMECLMWEGLCIGVVVKPTEHSTIGCNGTPVRVKQEG